MNTWMCPKQGLNVLSLATAAVTLAVCSTNALAQCPPGGDGADVIVGELTGPSNYGSVGGIEAVSLGTTSCNVGDAELLWISNTNQHPVIGQNLFRLNNGRFEHIGQAWLKHGFTALQQNACGCGCISSGTGTRLGVGCSDPYSSGLNGDQNGMGPKWQVNAHSGFFNWPASDFSNTGNNIYKRLQVAISDLDPALNGGGMYFSEGQYVTPDDCSNGNQNNSASYRRIFVSGSGSSWSFNYDNSYPTERTLAGIRAWQDHDPSVVESDVQIPGEGLVIVAAKVTDLGGGQWQYEYAVQNLNSDRSIGSFSVPVLASAIVTNIGFHDVDYHSGEPWDGTDWVGQKVGGEVVWNCPQTFAQNPNANAIRWGTLYNFRFVANIGPDNTSVSLGLFKPGSPNAVSADTIGPGQDPPDCNNNGVPDDIDIDTGFSFDCNNNSIPDECEPDCDGDFIPDDCELDSDLDGIVDDCDNCPDNFNPGQEDQDNDGIGDPCDPDFCDPFVFAHDMESDQGWTVGAPGDNASTGVWVRVNPVGTDAQPEDDHSNPGTQCWVTGQGVVGGGLGDNDIDGGTTTLVSPVFSLCGDATISYWRWYSNGTGAAPGADVFVIQVSNNGGSSWTTVETVGPNGPDTVGGWIQHAFAVSDFVSPSSQMRMRFVASDLGDGSVVEAAIDDFQVDAIDFCPTIDDCNGNCIDDATDIARGSSFDCNMNGIPDECEVGVPPCDTGACCLTDGSCSAGVTQDECVNILGGEYQGDGLDCGRIVCAMPTGACCFDDGSCADGLEQVNCEGAGGAYQGNGTDCGSVKCVAIVDCNGNGIDDTIDLLSGTSQDCNNNDIPDECDIASGFSFDCSGGPIGNIANGTKHWNSLCINCHGPDGAGNIGPNIQDYSRTQIMDKLAPADGDHPGGQYPEYTQQQFADLEAFLAQAGSRGRPDGIPDECQPDEPDCDDDGTSDACELESGSQVDADYDGIPDDCQLVTCLADMVGNVTFQPPPDGVVDGADLGFLLVQWGKNPGSPADIVDSVTFQPPPDGKVDGADLGYLLSTWGRCD